MNQKKRTSFVSSNYTFLPITIHPYLAQKSTVFFIIPSHKINYPLCKLEYNTFISAIKLNHFNANIQTTQPSSNESKIIRTYRQRPRQAREKGRAFRALTALHRSVRALVRRPSGKMEVQGPYVVRASTLSLFFSYMRSTHLRGGRYARF